MLDRATINIENRHSIHCLKKKEPPKDMLFNACTYHSICCYIWAACNNIVFVFAPNATAKTSVSICRLIDLCVACGLRMGCKVNLIFPNNCYHRRTSCMSSRDKSGAESLLYLESVIKESTSWKLPRNQFIVTTQMFSKLLKQHSVIATIIVRVKFELRS